ncbi:MAG TPA: ABC transporter permease [Methanofastidiosum sp.]|nr:ABC transporter permease [Methanofastidiosum sp.]HOI76099.1 ABC transporter permease [Methanofastidiosum sp.]
MEKRVKLEFRRNPISFIFFFIGFFIIIFVVGTLFNMLYKQLVVSPSNFIAILKDTYVLKSIGLTLYASFLATILAVLLGIPLAYAIARNQFYGKNIIESIIDIPVIIPHTVAGIALFSLLSRRGTVGTIFGNLGIVFQDSLWGIVIAMFFVSYPLFVNSAKEGFKSVNPNYERVARTLGASQFKSFYQIALPLSYHHLISGAIMSWARGISEFGAVVVIAYYPMIASTMIFYRFNTGGLKESQPIAVLLILLCFVVFLFLRLISRKK